MSTSPDATALPRYGYVVREEWEDHAAPGAHRFVSWHVSSDAAVRGALMTLWKWRLLSRLAGHHPRPAGVTVVPLMKPDFLEHQQRVCAGRLSFCTQMSCYPLRPVTRLFWRGPGAGRRGRDDELKVPDLMAALSAPTLLRSWLRDELSAASGRRRARVLPIAPRRGGRARQLMTWPPAGSSAGRSRRRRGRRPRGC